MNVRGRKFSKRSRGSVGVAPEPVGYASTRFNNPRRIYNYFDDRLLDRRILNLLIRRSLDGPRTFPGLSVKNILRFMGLPPTPSNVGKVRGACGALERGGLAYAMRGSRTRWFPSSRAVFLYGAVGQKRMEDYL